MRRRRFAGFGDGAGAGGVGTSALPILAVLAAIALSACARNGDPTAEQVARSDYASIAESANVALFGDALGYRPGAAAPERAVTVCRDASCSVGFYVTYHARNYSVEALDVEILPQRNGVRSVVERLDSDKLSLTAFGGWMKHSFFASQATLRTNQMNPNHGLTVVYAYAVGHSTVENPAAPEGGAQWRGFVVGRESSVTSSLESVVRGDAAIAVRMGPSDMHADVTFTGLANAHTGTEYGDMSWTGMAVTSGGFARRDAADDTIEGQFYGPGGEEVGGVFERSGISGAFGGRRPQ